MRVASSHILWLDACIRDGPCFLLSDLRSRVLRVRPGSIFANFRYKGSLLSVGLHIGECRPSRSVDIDEFWVDLRSKGFYVSIKILVKFYY
jgi:hypothetical protein